MPTGRRQLQGGLMKHNFEMREQPQHYRAKELLKIIKSEWAENKEVWIMRCYVKNDIKTILLTLDEIEEQINKIGGLKGHEVKIIAGTARKLASEDHDEFVLFETIKFERVTIGTVEKLANEAKAPTN